MKNRPEVLRVALFVLVVAGAVALVALNRRDADSPHWMAPPASDATQRVPASAIDTANGTGDAVARGAAADRVDANASACRLRVVDGQSLLPLAGGATIELLADGDGRGHVAIQAGPRGTAAWPAHVVGDVHVRVRCAGYVSLYGNLTESLVEQAARAVSADARDEHVVTFALQPAGKVAVRLTSRDGEPIANAAVALLPPLANGGDWRRGWASIRAVGVPDDVLALSPELCVGADGTVRMSPSLKAIRPGVVVASHHLDVATWTCKTNAEGLARFDRVMPATGYRFGVMGSMHAQPAPAFESGRLQVVDGGVRLGAAAPQNLSGQIDVVASATASGAAQRLGSGVVRGRLIGAQRSSVAVKLARIRQAGGDDGVEKVTTFDAEYAQPLDNGRFHFADVRPGVFALRACWLVGGRDVYFASRTFRLAPDDDLDLGAVQPMDGALATVRVGLRAGAVAMPAQDVFAAGSAAEAILTIAFQPDSQSAAEAVTEYARVPFGQEFVLHGVPSGSLQLQAQPVQGLASTAGIQRVDASEVVRLRIEQIAGVVEVPLAVVPGVRRVLDVRDDAGHAVHVQQLQVRHRTTGRVDSIEVVRDGVAPLVEDVALLEPGVYDAWLSVSLGGKWLAAALEIDASDPAPAVVAVELLPAATVRGTLVGVRGETLADTTVRWTPKRLADSGIWIFAARSDSEGRFEAHGIPPGVRVVQQGASAGSLPPLSAGQRFDAGVVIHEQAR
ncbi:MAG: hypothetical protein AB8H80_07005 [Planctomycetota bacterium]